jgi:hypothetical protein
MLAAGLEYSSRTDCSAGAAASSGYRCQASAQHLQTCRLLYAATSLCCSVHLATSSRVQDVVDHVLVCNSHCGLPLVIATAGYRHGRSMALTLPNPS